MLSPRELWPSDSPREVSPREPELLEASLCEGGVNGRKPPGLPLSALEVPLRCVSLADERMLLLFGGVNVRLLGEPAVCPPKLREPVLPVSWLPASRLPVSRLPESRLPASRFAGVPALGFIPAEFDPAGFVPRASFMPPALMRPPACTDDT